MKKIFLSVALVMATSGVMNASSSIEEGKSAEEVVFASCADDAWDFGTKWGKGNEREEYYWTDLYYSAFCE